MPRGKSAAFGRWSTEDGSKIIEDAARIIAHLSARTSPPAAGHVNSITSATVVVEGRPQRRRPRRMYRNEGPVKYCMECRRIVTIGHSCSTS